MMMSVVDRELIRQPLLLFRKHQSINVLLRHLDHLLVALLQHLHELRRHHRVEVPVEDYFSRFFTLDVTRLRQDEDLRVLLEEVT